MPIYGIIDMFREYYPQISQIAIFFNETKFIGCILQTHVFCEMFRSTYLENVDFMPKKSPKIYKNDHIPFCAF